MRTEPNRKSGKTARHKGWLPGADPGLVLLLAGVAALYLLTISGVNSIDTIYYFQHAEAAGGWSICHSHHLIFPQIVKGWYRLWQIAGWAGRAEFPLKVFSLLGTLGAVFFFFRLALLVLPQRRHAVGITLLFSFSYLPWCFSTQGEPVPWFLLFATWILLLQVRILRGQTPPCRVLVRLAVVTLVGAGFHQALVLTLPITLVVVWRRWGPQKSLAVTGSSAALIASAYLVGAMLGTTGNKQGTVWGWLTRYLQEFHQDYGRLDLILSSAPIRGGVSAFISGESLKSHVFSGTGYGPLALTTAAFCFWLAIVMISGWGLDLRLWRSRPRCFRRELLLLLGYGVIFAVAAIWWEPANRKFWAPVMPSIWLLAGLGWTTIRPRVGLVVWSVTLAALVSVNLAGGIVTKHAAHDSRQPLLVYLAEVAGPETVVVLRENRVWQCVDYYLHWPGIMVVPGPKSDNWSRRQDFLQSAVTASVVSLRHGRPVYCTSPLASSLIKGLAGEMPGDRLQVENVLKFWDSEEANIVEELQIIRLGEPVAPVFGGDRDGAD